MSDMAPTGTDLVAGTPGIRTAAHVVAGWAPRRGVDGSSGGRGPRSAARSSGSTAGGSSTSRLRRSAGDSASATARRRVAARARSAAGDGSISARARPAGAAAPLGSGSRRSACRLPRLPARRRSSSAPSASRRRRLGRRRLRRGRRSSARALGPWRPASSARGGEASGAAAWGRRRRPAPRCRTGRRPGGAAGRAGAPWPASSSLRCSGGAAGVDERAHRRERRRLEHRRPAVGAVGRLQRRRRRLAEPAGQRAGERHAGLGRHRRQPQGAHDPADVERGLDVGEPQRQLLVLLGDQRRLQLGGQLARRLVAGDDRVVGRGDDAAQVAQVEVLELALRRLGPVEPVGDAQPRDQLLGHLHHRRLRHLRLALGLQPGVVLAQPLAHGGDALQRQLGDRALLLGQRRRAPRCGAACPAAAASASGAAAPRAAA